jgi:hypothetical protein
VPVYQLRQQKKPAMALVNRRVIEGVGMKKKGKKDDKKKGK